MEEGEDRRKGLGPLQLLNVAFKKGKIKDAVVESKAIEHAQQQLEKEMEQTFGIADHQAIRRAILRKKSRRAKADFDEATFNEEAVNSRGKRHSSADMECLMLSRLNKVIRHVCIEFCSPCMI